MGWYSLIQVEADIPQKRVEKCPGVIAILVYNIVNTKIDILWNSVRLYIDEIPSGFDGLLPLKVNQCCEKHVNNI